MEALLEPQALISLATLTALEVVLGIDNIVFITILADKLPESQRDKARRLGLAVALISRLALLMSISWVMGLTAPLFTVMGNVITGRSLILLCGGVFLIGKATYEVYETVEGDHHGPQAKGVASFTSVIVQILILDLVFSLDSVITAVGMAEQLSVMAIAMILAVIIMLVFAKPIGDFVTEHPSMKVLALAFLILVGVLLTAEAFGKHVDKGYIYFAMAFSLLVELVNMRARGRKKPAPAQA